MKVLHTADWHLGVKTMGKDRLDGQKETLLEICDIADKNDVDIVLIAGDIYNTSIPSANAEELFYDIVKKLSNGGERVVVVVSGNHDDPDRLCAGLPLAYAHNIVLAGDMKILDKEKFPKNKRVEIVDCGYGNITIKKDEEYANISYLPFDSTIKERPNIENINYSQLVGELAEKASINYSDDKFNIFLSHLFVVGSKLSKDRVVSVGDVFAVSNHDLPKADYVALGHIHGNQFVNDNVCYSGAITRLRPGDYSVYVNIIKKVQNNVSIDRIELNNVEKYVNICARSLYEAETQLKGLNDRDLVQLEFVLDEPLKASQIKELKKQFPGIVSVSLEILEGKETNEKTVKFSRKNMTDRELFTAFYNKKRGVDPRLSLLNLFLRCKGGKDETN